MNKVRDLRRRLGSLRPRPADTTFRPLEQLTSDELRRELCSLSGADGMNDAIERSALDAEAAGLPGEAREFRKWADEQRAADLAATSRRFVDPLRDGNHTGPDDE